MGRERVAQSMARGALGDAGSTYGVLHSSLDGGRVNVMAPPLGAGLMGVGPRRRKTPIATPTRRPHWAPFARTRPATRPARPRRRPRARGALGRALGARRARAAPPPATASPDPPRPSPTARESRHARNRRP